MSEYLDATLAEAPASSGGPAAALPRTALLYTDDALLAHVEQTLAALRVPVVYRAALAQADHAALADARPEIALINLDDRCGEELDALTATLDAAGVPVVFNDADISHGLEGWARARWARHLCAKLCGKEDVDPPRPAQPAAMEAAVAAPAAGIELSVVAPVESAAPIQETAGGNPAAEEPASASRPLSQGEIDALVADFPSETVVAERDTETWSAQIDALLADAPDSASRDAAPWDVGFAETAPAPPAPAMVATGATIAVAAVVSPALPSSIDQWQLVDDFTPVAPAAKPAVPAPSINFDSGLALELEPLDAMESGQ
jgi:chemosensory pili system protein ChpB (putative protein-glutamate methylesterase)